MSSDEEHCGACNAPCAPDEACGSGVCGGAADACPPGYVMCDGECRDVSSDPEQCGSCTGVCQDGELCSQGACVCLPGLSKCGGACVDTASDPANCGGCAAPCGQVCTAGACGPGSACTADVCDGACVDTEVHPQHCGGCDNACAVDQLCAGGECADYEPAVGCMTCGGCNACPDGEICCAAAGYGVICVDTQNGCP